MITSLEGWPTKAKKTPSPQEVRMSPLDTNPVFQSLGGIKIVHYTITMKGNNTGLHQNQRRKVANDVVLQWIFCNIYSKELRTVIHDLHYMIDTSGFNLILVDLF